MSNHKSLPGFAFLAARTARSSIYLQTLAAAGVIPECVLLFGPASATQQVPETARGAGTPPFGSSWPDARIPAERVLADLAWPYLTVSSIDLAAPALTEALRQSLPNLRAIIFSGYPSQLAPQSLLDLAPIIHLHGGWLPEYRGSTTIYYAMLTGVPIGVSALRLDAGIDTGKLLMRAHYPPPIRGCDIDYVYDNAVRAELLARLLRQIVETGQIPPGELQPEGGRNYYIVHPVLKALATRNLPASEPPGIMELGRHGQEHPGLEQ
jgi:methionyl-tRNA formyltransferase